MFQHNKELSEKSSMSRNLKPLVKGNAVLCQNARTKKWDKSGVVVDTHPFRQYSVKMHGSGRISLRNRKHLQCIDNDKPTSLPVSSGKEMEKPDNTKDLPAGSTVEDTTGMPMKQQESPSTDRRHPPSGSSTGHEQPTREITEDCQGPDLPPRRSARDRKSPDYFSKEHKLHYKT